MGVGGGFALIGVIEQRRIDAFATFGRSPCGELPSDHEQVRVFTMSPMSPVLSLVCGCRFGARLSLDDSDRCIVRALRQFAARGPPVIWNTAPSTDLMICHTTWRCVLMDCDA
jgi:hypothetical protein